MEDGTGAIITLPTYPQLEKDVSTLVDEASGAVAGAQASASAALASANDSAKSASAASGYSEEAAQSRDTAGYSAASAKASAVAASTSEAGAASSASSAETSASASASSATASAESASQAQSQADTASASAADASASKVSAISSAVLAGQFANAPINVQVQPGQYSAFHWSEQARLISAGAMVFKGKFDASAGSYPDSTHLGDLYLVGTAGIIEGAAYSVGDLMFFDGAAWDRIDNQQAVTSVAGRTGTVVIGSEDVEGLQDALSGKANLNSPSMTGTPTIGGNPVPVSKTENKIYFGWEAGKLSLTVDSTAIGDFAIESWVKGTYAPLTGANFTGTVTSTGPFISKYADGFRITQGNYGTFWRNDGANLYLMITNAGDALGNWNNYRPMVVNLGDASVSTASLWTFQHDDNTFTTAAPLRFTGFGESGVVYIHGQNGSGDDIMRLARVGAGNYAMTVNGTISANDVTATSDQRLKTDHSLLLRGIDALKQMPPREYTKAGRRELGYFANEAQRVIPEAVHEGQDGYLLLSYGQVTALLGSAVLELDRRLKAVENC